MVDTMKWKLFLDARVDLLFLAIFLIFPINTQKGYSIILLNIIDFSVLSSGYIYLIAGFFIALVASHIVVNIYDERNGKHKNNKK